MKDRGRLRQTPLRRRMNDWGVLPDPAYTVNDKVHLNTIQYF